MAQRRKAKQVEYNETLEESESRKASHVDLAGSMES
jgi:hypothetical protein